ATGTGGHAPRGHRHHGRACVRPLPLRRREGGTRSWRKCRACPGGFGGRLDRPFTAAYRGRMDHAELIAQLRAMAVRVDALAARAQQLAEENRSLRQQQEQLAGERSQLLAKNEQARSRVEAMIARLKSDRKST